MCPAFSCRDLSLGTLFSVAVMTRPQRPRLPQAREHTHWVDHKRGYGQSLHPGPMAPGSLWLPGRLSNSAAGDINLPRGGLLPMKTGDRKEPVADSLSWCSVHVVPWVVPDTRPPGAGPWGAAALAGSPALASLLCLASRLYLFFLPRGWAPNKG